MDANATWEGIGWGEGDRAVGEWGGGLGEGIWVGEGRA